jgi:putative hydrolase of the HAD superfamily/hydrolase
VDLRGLIVDWGGVLTERLDLSIRTWAEQEGTDLQAHVAVIRAWFDAGPQLEAWMNPIFALECGEIDQAEFERQVAERLRANGLVAGHAAELLAQMFDTFAHAPATGMNALVLRARRAGVRTALLSNSWGNEYPRDGWDDMFDAVVVSGEVGLRKPEREIFELTCARLGMEPAACVFVDDLQPNVDAAAALGITAVLHREYDETAARLEELLGVPLAGG